MHSKDTMGSSALAQQQSVFIIVSEKHLTSPPNRDQNSRLWTAIDVSMTPAISSRCQDDATGQGCSG